MTRLLVEVEDFVTTARDTYDDVGTPLARAAAELSAALFGVQGMAGDDPVGRSWAEAYDGAAAAAVTALAAVIDANLRLASLFGQSARNYARADALSTPGEQNTIVDLLHRLPPDTDFGAPALPPTAVGPGAGLPSGWGLVHDLVGYVWPNGHQDRLHRASRAWRAAASALDEAAGFLLCDPILFTGHGLPEAPDVSAACADMAEHLRNLADVFRGLGDACTALASSIDWAHTEVYWDLGELAAWITATEAAAGVTAAFTFGLSEVAGGEAVVEECVSTAADIAAILSRFGDRVTEILLRLPPIRDLCEDITALTARLRNATLLRPAFAGVPNLGRIGMVSRLGDGEIAATERLATGANTAHAVRVDLTQAELDGGHTVTNHVGRTDAQLQARGIDVASTFYDVEKAEVATTQNLLANAGRIRKWLAGSSGKLVISSPIGKGFGRVYVRATSTFVEPTTVTTVLVRTSGGYRVQTSFVDL